MDIFDNLSEKQKEAVQTIDEDFIVRFDDFKGLLLDIYLCFLDFVFMKERKSIGWIKNPKKAAYNKVYKKTSFGIMDLFK